MKSNPTLDPAWALANDLEQIGVDLESRKLQKAAETIRRLLRERDQARRERERR